ncbi:MAG: M50 family metallopeptidase, partial [Streptosporangiaceae bacterium]
ETQPPLSGSTSVLLGAGALVAVTIPATWSVARHWDVMAHEGSHAFIGALFGMKVDYVRLNKDATGLTILRGSGRGLLSSFVGYLGSSLFGLGAAKLIALGHSVAVLWVTLVLLAVLLLRVRTIFGVVSIVLSGLLIFAVARYGAVRSEVIAAYAIGWLLLLSGPRNVLVYWAGSGDADDLAKMTKMGKQLWPLLWLAGGIAAVIVGGSMLV